MRAIDELLMMVPLTEDEHRRLDAAVSPGRVVTDPAALASADVVVTPRDPGSELAGASRLAWVHVAHAGLDGGDLLPLLDAGVIVTSGAGRSAEALAEHTLYFLLALNGGYRRFHRAQRWRVWGIPGQEDRRALRGQTVLVVGTGHTGRAVAVLCAALGMRVLGHRRRDVPVGEPFERVTSTDRGERLDVLLPEADAVVLAASLNDGSRHLIGATELAAMRQGSLLVNVARGGLVDEDALVLALEQGHLGGAATDVVEGEPLAVSSPLWRAPNLLITPHSTPQLDDRDERAFVALLANIERYRRGAPMENRLGRDDVYTGPPMRRDRIRGVRWRRLVRRWL